MGMSRAGENVPGARAQVLGRAVDWLLTNSLVLYLVAALLQRTWWLLNADLGQLLRRY